MKLSLVRCSFVIFLVLLSGSISAQYWPKEITGSRYKILMYQPQLDSLNGYILTGISAFSVTPKGKTNPIFGALFFEGKIDVDRDNRMYTLVSLKISNIKFSADEHDVNLDSVKYAIQNDVVNWQLTGSMDELITTLENSGNWDDKGSENFNNDPPHIIFTTKPSVLIIIDGEPVIRDIDSTNLKRVINSAFIIFQDKANNQFYLFGGEDAWFSSPDLRKGWSLTTVLPAELQKLMDANKENAEKAASVNVKDKDSIPEIIVVTEPSELIQTGGEPAYASITGTSLLYVSNSYDNIFKDINTQEFYILKSGRWFASRSLDSGWRYVAPLSIPADFAKIPEGSERDIVLASVPGTVEARDAILDTRIPVMATVDRATAGKELVVEYDGRPQFEDIEGTSLQLAKNASKTVFLSGFKFYALDNGVWYESPNNSGPWEVSTSRPADVENIPPSSPAYSAKFVDVYESTPETVTVGYTMGYTNSFVCNHTVVYGTGIHYTPWVGVVFMPMPMTWGFGMHFNPWWGWSMGWGMGWGMGMRWGMGMGMGWGMGMTMGWGMGMGMGMRMGFGMGMGMGMGMRVGWGMGMWGPPRFRPPMGRPPQSWNGSNRPGGVNNQRPPSGNQNRPGGRPDLVPGGNYQGINNNRPGAGVGRPGGGQGNYTGNNLYQQAANGNTGVRPGINNNRPGNQNINSQPGKNPGYQAPTTGNRQPNAGNNNNRPATNRPGNTVSNRPNNVYANNQGNVYSRNSTNNQWQQRNNNSWSNTGSANNNRLNTAEANRNRGAQRTNSYQQMNRGTQSARQPTYRAPSPSRSSSGARRR